MRISTSFYKRNRDSVKFSNTDNNDDETSTLPIAVRANFSENDRCKSGTKRIY